MGRPRSRTRKSLPRTLAPLLLVAGAGACAEAPRPSSVLLITIDTLRADHLGAYEPTVTTTPRIDRLAQESTIFENATCPMPLTRPSHFSILTSLYPREHGVLNNALALPESEVTLAEMLREAGWRTGAFVGVRLLNEESGATQGFEAYTAPTATTRSAEVVVTEALDWVNGLDAAERFFLWVHVFDPHLPYAPPGELSEGFFGELDPKLLAEYPAVDWAQIYEIAARHDGHFPERYFEHAKDLYRGDVAYTDRWIGELIDGLGPRLDDTLTILTADHGESFGNGIYFEHADCLYEGAMRIPLLVRYPPLFEPGRRVASVTANLDVAPTVLEALGLDVPPRFSGRSLLNLDGTEERYVLLQHPFFQPRAAKNRPEKRQRLKTVAGQPVHGVRVDTERVGLLGDDWKYLRTGDAEELYPAGPGADEERNLAEQEGSARETMERRLEELSARHPLRILEQEEIGEELLEALRALGYVDGE